MTDIKESTIEMYRRLSELCPTTDQPWPIVTSEARDANSIINLSGCISWLTDAGDTSESWLLHRCVNTVATEQTCVHSVCTVCSYVCTVCTVQTEASST